MKTSIVMLFLFASQAWAADTTVAYTESTARIRNPERGFEYATWTFPDGYPQRLVNPDSLEKYKDSTWSLVQSVFYLSQFISDSISQARLDSIDHDLDTLRAHGYKAVLSFAYGTEDNDWRNYADLSWMRIHLDQLQPVIEDNIDVIAWMHAGLIGQWGEWGTLGIWTDSTRLVQDSLLTKLLSIVPADRFVGVRCPRYKIHFMTDTTNIDSADAFDGSNRSRLGFHNDAILSSWDDGGTYLLSYNDETDEWTYDEGDTAIVKPYIAEDTRFTPMDGEFSQNNDTFQEECLAEFARLHWSALAMTGSTYGIWDEWWANGFADTVYKRLGYRYVLDSAYVSTSVTTGGSLHVRLRIRNVGWAPIYNYRPVEIVLRDNADQSVHRFTLTADPRRWEPGLISIVDQDVTITGNLDTGPHSVLLNLPDSAATISTNPDYSVQLANAGTWEAETGYNDLGITTEVSAPITKRLLKRVY